MSFVMKIGSLFSLSFADLAPYMFSFFQNVNNAGVFPCVLPYTWVFGLHIFGVSKLVYLLIQKLQLSTITTAAVTYSYP